MCQLAYEDLEIGEVLGRGASSVVLHAMHAPTGTLLALKVEQIADELSCLAGSTHEALDCCLRKVINLFDKSKREQLIREICTLYDAACPRYSAGIAAFCNVCIGGLTCPLLSSLITFYGAFYREGAITIALEYMDGGSLANVIDQVGPVPEPALANIAFQILWGLAYMKHDKRVHRDVKPSNLLINSRGEVKVTDFGVSAELINSIAMCATFVGTFKYMSPERMQNRPYRCVPGSVSRVGVVTNPDSLWRVVWHDQLRIGHLEPRVGSDRMRDRQVSVSGAEQLHRDGAGDPRLASAQPPGERRVLRQFSRFCSAVHVHRPEHATAGRSAAWRALAGDAWRHILRSRCRECGSVDCVHGLSSIVHRRRRRDCS